MKNFINIFKRWVLALAALAFFVCYIVASDTISNILHQVALAIWNNVINTKLFIGIAAFVIGTTLSTVCNMKKLEKAEAEKSLLQEELADTKSKLEYYQQQELALKNEMKESEDNRFKNGQTIFSVLKNA